MLIEQALITYLLAQSGITDYVGDRIYQVRALQNARTPYLVVTKISGVREHSHDGSSELAHPRFQFSAFSTTYNEAKNIIAAVQTALQGYSGTMGGGSGVSVGACFYENEADYYEIETKLFHVLADYVIWHTES